MIIKEIITGTTAIHLVVITGQISMNQVKGLMTTIKERIKMWTGVME